MHWLAPSWGGRLAPSWGGPLWLAPSWGGRVSNCTADALYDQEPTP